MNTADLDPVEYFASLDRTDEFTSEDDLDSNAWVSVDETYDKYDPTKEDGEDWEDVLKRRMDGSVWSSFESSEDEGKGKDESAENLKKEHELDDDGEAAWLDTLASITAEEIEFNLQEADRASLQNPSLPRWASPLTSRWRAWRTTRFSKRSRR